ncbi:tetratricopeptide repeat protein [Kitasatospora sp. NPDC088134]|uniref:tetratricopeptide repeat protein n=1 Tax=Kitasatospora sp. NPDC088134 TaxID=3364071 RepID=UPI003818C906
MDPRAAAATDPRTVDTLDKTAELDRLTAGTDAGALWDAVGRARTALDFRDADAVLGLPPVDGPTVRQLADRVERAVARAVELRLPAALVDRAETLYFGPAAADPAAAAEAAAEAFACAEAAGELPRAAYLLGLFHGAGYGCAVDEARSRAWHESAARAGDADAMFELYVLCTTGVGGPADPAAGVDWCHRAAEAGSVRAMANLGGFYATGNGVPADLPTSLRWYRLAAESGHGRAAAVLGVMTAAGEGEQPPAEAGRWLELADELGFDWRPMARAYGLDLEPDLDLDLDRD